MAKAWIKYRGIGLLFGYRFWWPSGWRGGLFFLFLAVLWLGGGNAISILLLPYNPLLGWLSIGALALVGIILFELALRYRGEKI